MILPPRWLGCPRRGDVVADKFLPFKTPLDDRYDDLVEAGEQWKFSLLFGYLKSRSINLGMVIDLTKSGRFYDSRELEKYNVAHHKLACAGHEESPTTEQVALFIHVCRQFFLANPGAVIGVHCTHGFNRTGFLISAFLCEEAGYSIEVALQQFSRARPPGILKEHYLQDLCKRYDGDPSFFAAPELPDWFHADNVPSTVGETSYGLGDTGSTAAGDGRQPAAGNGQQFFSRKRKHSATLAPPSVSLEGIESVMSVTEHVEELQRRLCELCRSPVPNIVFPGAQPVSLDRDTIKYFESKPYRVSWKADGTRYLMMILSASNTYLFDRKLTVFHVPQVAFPGRTSPHVKDTVVDGELVFDDEQGTKVPRFLMYDIVTLDGQDVGKFGHVDRHAIIERELLRPRDEMERTGRLDKRKEPFRIRIKPFWDIERTKERVLEQVIPVLNHPNDGLIFSPANEGYQMFTNPDLLKWKPPELNSIDFLLKIVKENRLGELPTRVGELYVVGQDVRVGTIKLTKELKTLHNKIIECTVKDQQWSFMRVREDKDKANSYSTYESVWKSLQQPVTKEILLDFIAKRRYRVSQPSKPKPQLKRPSAQQPNQQQSQQQGLMPPPPAPAQV